MNDLRATVRRPIFENAAELFPHGAGALAISGKEGTARLFQVEARSNMAQQHPPAQSGAFEHVHGSEYARRRIKRQVIARRDAQNLLAGHSQKFKIDCQIHAFASGRDEARRITAARSSQGE